ESMTSAPRVAHASASRVAWLPVEVAPGTSADGRAIDVVQVHAGEVVRIDVATAAIDVGERVRGGGAEVWRREPAEQGVVTFRPGMSTSAILVPRGGARRILAGRAWDPGYAWFELEDRVIDWADG